MKISGCIIARNEEANIAKCIRSLQSIVHEIVVVDTGSNDNTVRIAQELGADVYRHEWENNFSKAKNTALGYATGDWIVFLDADEYFSDGSLQKARSAIELAHSYPDIDGLYCDMEHIDKDTDRVVGRNITLRIFRNDERIRFMNRIHEVIRKNGAILKCADNSADLTILHTGYSAALFKTKTERNLQLLLADPEAALSSYYLANSYSILNDYDKALTYADIALNDPAVASQDHFAYQMYMVKINSMMSLGYVDDAQMEETIRQAKAKFPYQPEIARAEADYLLYRKKYGKALGMYAHALDCHEKHGKTQYYNSFPSVIHEVYTSMGLIHFLLNRETEALEWYMKACKANKYDSKAFKSLLLLTRQIPENEVIAFINRVYQINKEDDLRLIISQIADCGRARIVLYYVKLWNNTFGHEDDALIYAFLSMQDYRQALQIALIYLKAAPAFAPLAASVVVLGAFAAEMPAIREQMDAVFGNILTCYFEGLPYTGDRKAYLDVFLILNRQAQQHVMDRFLSLCVPGSDLEWDISHALLSDAKYTQAIAHYQTLFEHSDSDETKALAAFNAGFCHYKRMEYRQGLAWFSFAADYGYGQNDLPEFLHAVVQSTDDAEIKAMADHLLVGSKQ